MIVAGIRELRLDTAVATVRRHMLLLAPPYGPFAASERMRAALGAALSLPDGARLTAVCLPDLDAQPWVEELLRLLRPGFDRPALEHELLDSRTFLRALRTRFGERVRLLQMGERPCLPVVVDARLFFGHFAHSRVPTPEGFWGAVPAPVAKACELLPLGPVTFYDTAGLDDAGELGELRATATRRVPQRTDPALLVAGDAGLEQPERAILETLRPGHPLRRVHGQQGRDAAPHPRMQPPGQLPGQPRGILDGWLIGAYTPVCADGVYPASTRDPWTICSLLRQTTAAWGSAACVSTCVARPGLCRASTTASWRPAACGPRSSPCS